MTIDSAVAFDELEASFGGLLASPAIEQITGSDPTPGTTVPNNSAGAGSQNPISSVSNSAMNAVGSAVGSAASGAISAIFSPRVVSILIGLIAIAGGIFLLAGHDVVEVVKGTVKNAVAS